MRLININVDLRLLSLLHALRDKEEFSREVRRLMAADTIDKESWVQICRMGKALCPEDELFIARHGVEVADSSSRDNAPPRRGPQHEFDRRRQDRRDLSRRIKLDRRLQERRVADLPWLGAERRRWERRQYDRRCPSPAAP